jgi:hypothetical protein
MTVLQRVFFRLFCGVGLLAICTYLFIEILKDTTIYSVLATLITTATIGIACFLIVWNGE